jgi:DNA repair photolyase
MSQLVTISVNAAGVASASSAPPHLKPPARHNAELVGIARMAAQSPQVRARAGTEYFALQSRSVLNRESSGRLPFAWTINPYRGCEFGCHYCYARYSHEFLELWDGRDFERKIFAKVNAPELLRAELRRARDKGLPIALGTATDPYQPAEKQFRITREMLEVISAFEGLNFSITTKGTLILRDLDLLKTISAKHRFSVHMTVTTTNERLARLLEPKAPHPSKRLEAVAALAKEGIAVGVNVMPILPGLTDSERSLQELARRAAESGAKFLHGNVLFLMPSAVRQFMPFLEREFPKLVKRYRKLYARSAYLNGEYKERMTKIVADIRARHGLDGTSRGGNPPHTGPQLALPFGW